MQTDGAKWSAAQGGSGFGAMSNGAFSQQRQQPQDFSNANPTTNSPPQFTRPQPGVLPDANAFNPATTGFSPPDPNMVAMSGVDSTNMDFTNNPFGAQPDLLSGTGTGMGMGSFQQPFVPQDLWQMPMTLEWDWAEGLGLGSFTPGPMFEFGSGQDGMMGAGMGGQGQ
jgi:hypothetical protein